MAFHCFADNIQLSKSVHAEDIHATKQAVIDCVLDIRQWSSSCCLKLNASKSEVIWIGTQQQLAKLSEVDRTLESDFSHQQCLETLVYIDEQLSMDANTRHCH